MSNADVYDRITAKVIAALDEGTAPWHKPWATSIPRSMSTGKPYRGINVFLLDGGYWGTYKKVTELGGQVRKGERSSVAVFWKFVEKVDKETGEKRRIPFLRHFNVFHTSQCEWPDGLPAKFQPREGGASEEERITAAEQMVTEYVKGENGPRLFHGGERACYSPATDVVNMPELTSFDDVEHYYSVMFHELGHSTGHGTRLNREGVTSLDMFGSHRYAREELVAEMTAAMLTGLLGIESTIETSASYIAHWRDAIANDNRLVVKAAGEAQKAADLIQGISWENEE